MLFRTLIIAFIGIGLTAASAQTPERGHGSSLDSTDRETYVYTGPPVPFGSGQATVQIQVGEYFYLNDVDVFLTIEHTWDSDVHATLVSPGGQRVILISAVGGSGDNFINTYLNDAAPFSINDGQPPFTGSFRPIQPLSGFNGGEGRGTWQLVLEDIFPLIDDGQLNAWTLTLGGRIGGTVSGVVTDLATEQPLSGVRVEAVGTPHAVTSDTLGRYRLLLPDGRYNVRFSRAEWCSEKVDSIAIANLDTVTLNMAMGQPLAIPSHTSVNEIVPPGVARVDSLYLFNAGNCELEWEVTSIGSWLTVLDVEGTTAAGDSSLIKLRLDAQGLEQGEYEATIRITHSGPDSPIIIPAFMIVWQDAGADEGADGPPSDFSLAGVYPNPFNSQASIAFVVPRPSTVQLDLYDVLGRKSATVMHGLMEPGRHLVRYDASALPSGVYYLRMTADHFSASAKVLLIR